MRILLPFAFVTFQQRFWRALFELHILGNGCEQTDWRLRPSPETSRALPPAGPQKVPKCPNAPEMRKMIQLLYAFGNDGWLGDISKLWIGKRGWNGGCGRLNFFLVDIQLYMIVKVCFSNCCCCCSGGGWGWGVEEEVTDYILCIFSTLPGNCPIPSSQPSNTPQTFLMGWSDPIWKYQLKEAVLEEIR